MRETDSCTLIAGRGIDSENRKPGKREVTLISAEAWENACQELGTQLPWYTRRANILIRGLDLPSTIGKTIAIGPIRVRIHGETKPCGIMDQQHAGLRKTLVPSGRGGVYGQVLVGGTARVGDYVSVVE